MLSRRSSIQVLLLFFILEIHGQVPGTDTLFKPSELYYFSELERESFMGYFEGTPDYLSMITALNPGTGEGELEMYRNWVNEILGDIRTRRFDGLSESKKLKRIKEHLGRSLLITYDHRTNFDALFRYGKYNYLTAAAIYSFLFEELDIPYEICETPARIYLLTYPMDKRITLEINGKDSQYFMFGYETRTDFVEFLKNSGVIDEFTFQNTSTRGLFERYYFAGSGLGQKEILGMLYLNSAVSYLERGDEFNAYYQLEKAFMLYPSYKSQYLLLSQLGSFLQQMDYHNTRDLGFLVKAFRLVGYGIENDLIRYYFTDIVNTVLVEQNDEKTFAYISDYIHKFISDTILTRDFDFLALYEKGRLAFNDTRYDDALESFESAFRIYPENENNQNLLVGALAGYSTLVDPAMVLEKIEHYDTAFTEIESEDVYTLVKLNTYLELFGKSFRVQDEENGEKYLALFEELMDRHPGTSIDHILIGRSYSSATLYYYRKGQVNRSKELVYKGLRYAPGNIELKLKLAAFE
jgi:tetratricopeptide (TPR) repeat protein